MEGEKKDYKPKNMRLSGIPKDVYDILLKAQTDKKIECNCTFSLESTVYSLIRKAAKQ